MRTREFIRCPVCGKLSRGPAFGAALTLGHSLEIMVQAFIGGRRHGFRWSHAPLRVEVLSTLVRVVETVLERLRVALRLAEAAVLAQLVEAVVAAPTPSPVVAAPVPSFVPRASSHVPALALSVVPGSRSEVRNEARVPPEARSTIRTRVV